MSRLARILDRSLSNQNKRSSKLHQLGGLVIIKIPVQVPAIERCFMSIDEIARIFSKSRSPYIGGEIGIDMFHVFVLA